MSDIYNGSAGERKQSPPSDSIGDRERDGWGEMSVGDHTITRGRGGFTCTDCSESHPYPSEFEGVECGSDD